MVNYLRIIAWFMLLLFCFYGWKAMIWLGELIANNWGLITFKTKGVMLWLGSA